ncbi:DUF167 domain-containing protein [Herbaspirillum sp. RTI4]|uniref:DUF167 domain-containing protein n=1 Tax=Herbaspirillum sp. RTI4 TaxID=3048640 RepID=UPI002AB46EA7|nr:DUF167 domain-containing protein [Herbaspirillum sp. RTI4]MDY7577519.1 DUF167 domain-containing protein [Herbaspirillum sp. RTI4]MEA9980994.1 DUF167 domain-containing protein [Herbaspirillum sp. RTI4]
MTYAWCQASGEGVRLTLRIAPNAKKSEVIGEFDTALKIRLHAPPVDGKANEALIRFIAERLDLPRSAVVLLHGMTSKQKVLAIHGTGLDAEAVGKRLLGV